MENFLTWDNLMTYTTFISCVFMLVEFTKEIPFINKIPTKYWSFFIAVSLLIAINVVMGTFKWVDLVIYLLTAVSISLGSNGLSNFNNEKESE